MKQVENLAKGVIQTALSDLVTVRYGSIGCSGCAYVDLKGNIFYSMIKKENIDIKLLQWFESESRERYSYRYWLSIAGYNGEEIKKYIKKIRAIYNGEIMEDELINGPAEYEKSKVEVLRGFRNEVRPRYPSNHFAGHR